ncbi:MAG: DNA polymerase III subunit gamma/tau [Bdellovibrionales bacterium]
MSYEVIARRWRPQDFEGLVGQDHIRTTLINALHRNRLHHALLFTGPRGTGKTSTARILAKALRCPNAKDFVPCNTCSECVEITSGRSVNVIEIDGASNNGVDAIRELRDTVGYLPASGQFKLYIIDEVHMLSTSAFNALLKTLEEPPSHVYFVMATTEAQKIPNTILSRCQRFDFRRIPTRAIAQHLQTICERDGVKFESEALWTIARQGDGSMRDSQSLLDQVINFTNGDLRRELVVSTLGLTDRGLLLNLLRSIMSSETTGVLAALSGLHQSGNDPKLLLLDMMEQIRNTLLLKLNADRARIDLPDSEQEALLQMSTALSPEDLHLLFDMALKGAQDLARAMDPLLVLEMVLLRMATAPRITAFQASAHPAGANAGSLNPTATVTRAETPKNPVIPNRSPAAPHPTGTGAPGPTSSGAPRGPGGAGAAPQPVVDGRSTPDPNSPLEVRFKELVERIKEVNGLIGAQLENCFVVSLEQKLMTLGVSNKHKFLFDKISQPDFRKKVVNYLNSFWGPGYSLDIQLREPGRNEETSPKVLAERMERERQHRVRQAVEAHPLVQSAQSVFKAEIKAIKEMKEIKT